ncbi:YraN family protein [Nitratiruptor sp. YY09-18]|uniref:YraN family protein n=1 Tax=Nitratiruptor sp. YY09-18 TaxID=2724901 RepID=UPI00191567DC|nr:YraN family protein [Nitratiruptor sp. YY09-18]BCD68657.1 putative endonuclease [Nitratiruptor sp. YY09-18]
MGKEAKITGNEGEERAVVYLIKHGYEIVERNFYAKFGEIDIIAKKDGTIHFFEVKTSSRYEPIFAITPAKMQKIYKAIEYYLMKNNITLPYQVDAILVKNSQIELVENISI